MMGGKRPSLAGKLLLSSALVAVSLAYGWWQRHTPAVRDKSAALLPSITANSTLAPTQARSDAPIANPPVAQKIIAPPKQTLPARAPLTALAELRMYQPPPAQTPLPLVTGTPAPGIAAPAHLADGDYLSDVAQYEWGDLQVKIAVQDGQIRGVQIVQYPDHRAESLQISQMASPLLGSEVIKTQQAKVDVVSSATDTSFVFRGAVANAIAKAAR